MPTINLKKAYDEQTKIRHQLLANGYRPLPTAEKIAFLKAWPTIPVNDKVIDGWPMTVQRYGENERLRMVPAVTTAIQLTGNMLAIDVDVQDQRVADEISKLIGWSIPRWDEAPIRDSGGAKFMVLCATPTPYAMWKTAKYIDAMGTDHMVEVYGGAATRYFSCFGPHTLGGVVNGEYEVKKAYSWYEDAPNPLNMSPDDLPVIGTDELEDLMRKIADLLAGQPGWERVAESREGHAKGGVEYDLTEDMVFATKDGEMGWLDAIAYAMTERDARCSGSFLDGIPHTNLTRCRMSSMGTMDEPALGVFDNEGWTQHLPASWAPRTQEERDETVRELGERLAAIMPRSVEEVILEAQEAGEDTAEFEAKVDELLESLAFNYATGQYHHLRRGMIWNGVTKATLKDHLKQFDLTWEGPRGGRRRYSVVDAWNTYDDRLQIAGVRFNPRTEERIVRIDGEVYANGYFGLKVPDAARRGHESTVLARFLEHLIPHDEEREWFLDWLAQKFQKPWTRNCAVLFVAPGVQGAGRGTLFSILDKVFNRYTMTVSERDLLSARFNEFMENNLIVFSNELGGLGWTERKQGYEALKDRVDPAHHTVTIERKGITSYRTETFVSFMLATNNAGGLTMDAEDRRFAIISNGDKLEGELLGAVLAVGLDTLAELLAASLVDRKVTREVADAPAFKAREQMLEMNMTDVDEAIREVAQKAPAWRAWKRSDFEKAVKFHMTGSTTQHVKGLRQAVSDLQGKRAQRMGAELIDERVWFPDNSTHAVVAKNSYHFLSLSPDEREKVTAGTKPDDDATNVVPLD